MNSNPCSLGGCFSSGDMWGIRPPPIFTLGLINMESTLDTVSISLACSQSRWDSGFAVCPYPHRPRLGGSPRKKGKKHTRRHAPRSGSTDPTSQPTQQTNKAANQPTNQDTHKPTPRSQELLAGNSAVDYKKFELWARPSPRKTGGSG